MGAENKVVLSGQGADKVLAGYRYHLACCALEDLVVDEYGEGHNAEAVQAWLKEYPDVLTGSPDPAI